MEGSMRANKIVLMMAVVCLAAGLAHADIEIREEHSFAARPGQTVVVDVSFHKVEVEIQPGDTVHAVVELSSSSSSSKAQKAMDELAPVFEEKGNILRIRSNRKGGWSWFSGKVKGHVTVTMPPDLDLEVDSSSGSITIDGDFGDGAVSCDASSGSVTVRGAMRDLAVDTSSGAIRADVSRPLERFLADASSGSVKLEGGAHAAAADTSSGSITLLGLLGDATMDASSGSITAQWDSVESGAKIRAGASSGSVTIRLPAGTEIAGKASTSSGGIRSDFPGTFERSKAKWNGGPGAVDIAISTSSGGVKVIED
jgi:DUF4097 and DUF4098 domain-containing protein YvlB